MATVTSARPVEEAVDLLAPRAERHRAVEHRDAARVQAVDLAREREHRLAAEGDDDGARREAGSERSPTNSSGSMRSKTLTSACGNAFSDERLRVERAEQEDVAVLAGEQQPRPGGAALGVVRPLHLVEHEHLARARRHLDRAADDRRVVVDPLLAGDEADALLAELGREPAVRLLREHPQRRRVDAAARSLRNSSASYVLPEFVGPRCATTVSGSTRRVGSVISIGSRGTRIAPARRRAVRSERLGASPGRVAVCAATVAPGRGSRHGRR